MQINSNMSDILILACDYILISLMTNEFISSYHSPCNCKTDMKISAICNIYYSVYFVMQEVLYVHSNVIVCSNYL